MRVRHIRSVHELKPADWERLSSGRTVYLGRPWLEWAEGSDDYESQYLLAEEPDGSVVGALPTYFWRGGSGVSMNQAYHPLDLLAVPRLGTEAEADRHLWMPLLLLGSRAGYHGGVLVDPALPASSRARVIARLIQAAAELAETLGASAMALLYAPQAHAEECLAALAALAPDVPAPSYAPLSAEAVIPVATVDTERSARRRREWQREARAFADSGGSIHRVRLSECYRQAGPLLGLLQRKYGADDTDESMTAYLGQQAACLDPWSEVFLERRDGRLTGFALCYLWGDTLHVRAAGFAPDAGPYAYFNLAVYEPLALAASLGLAWLDLGTGAYRGKILRGARLRTTHALVWPPRGSRESVRSALLLPGEDYLDATG
ncbi:GNAT family N-acetyltransferase [Streptomyces sp. NPDC058470]|uniref:GNAT family N-acetyltransferase n=1 Tax=Streptomyces sp. NPDC058470 TaxID=3346515 RepID=UPI003668F7F4